MAVVMAHLGPRDVVKADGAVAQQCHDSLSYVEVPPDTLDGAGPARELIGSLAVLRLIPSSLGCLSGRTSTCSARRPRMWTGHAELSELGVARFAFYLMHDRKESTLKVYGFTVLSPVY